MEKETKYKQEAQELHDRIKADLWRQCQLNEKPDRLWQEAVVRWLKENKIKLLLGPINGRA